MPEVSGETVVERDRVSPGGIEEGEVTGGAHAIEDMIVLDEPESHDNRLNKLSSPTNSSDLFIYIFILGSRVP